MKDCSISPHLAWPSVLLGATITSPVCRARLFTKYNARCLVASAAKGATVPALIDAITFASIPRALSLSRTTCQSWWPQTVSPTSTPAFPPFSMELLRPFFSNQHPPRLVDASQLGGSAQSLTSRWPLLPALPVRI